MPLDFAAINAAALAACPEILKGWLPGGKVRGREFVCGNLAGEPGESLSVNMQSGVWRDFAAAVGGGDLISLYAAIRSVKQGEAAKAMAHELGLSRGRGRPPKQRGPGAALKRRETGQTTKAAAQEMGQAEVKDAVVLPVPAEAPAPPDEHPTLGTPTMRWAYRDTSGQLLGYVCRWNQPGGKTIRPLVYTRSPQGRCRWQWQTWAAPKPLYGLDRLPGHDAVVLCEGEKAADAAQRMLGDGVACLTWPGGVGAVGQADFSPLTGKRVRLWPDHDAPGLSAMAQVATLLQGVATEVKMANPPADAPAKWDAADAEADGWAFDDVKALLGAAVEPPVADAPARSSGSRDENPSGSRDASPPDPREDDPSGPRDADPPGPRDEAIKVRAGQLDRVADAIEERLLTAEMPEQEQLYQRGGMLVRILRHPQPGLEEEAKQCPTSTNCLPLSGLNYLASKHCRFVKWDGRSENWRRCDPPETALKMVHQKSVWGFPVLKGFAHAPTMDATGRVVSQPGYDVATGLYLTCDMQLSKEPASRTRAEIGLAALLELLSGFPFVAEADKSAAIAMLMTALLRPMLPTAPLLTINATDKGSGKSTLMQLACVLALGQKMAGVPFTKDAFEFEKRIHGCLLAGDNIVCMDNVNNEFSNDFLCQAITETMLRMRPLGSSEMVSLPNTTLYMINGNNCRPSGDLVRRTVLCNLDSRCEKPEERTFSFDPLHRVLRERAGWIDHVLAIPRGWLAEGAPPQKLTPFGSFTDWSLLVREPLAWLGLADPLSNRDKLDANDVEGAALAAVLTAWHEGLGSIPRTTKEAVVWAKAHEESELQEALENAAGDKNGNINTRSLGWWLRRNAGRIKLGLCIQKAGKFGHAEQWKVEMVQGDN